MPFTLTANLRVNPPSNIGLIVRNINSQLKRVNGNLNFNVSSQTSRQLSHLNGQMKQFGRSAKEANGYVEALGRSAAASVRRYAGFTIFATAFYNLAGAIKSSLVEAIAFQREMVKIRQVTGIALKDLKPLGDEVTRLATTFGISSSKLLNVAQIFAQAGYNAEDTKKALAALAKTEVAATFEDIQDTAEGSIAAMAQFGIKVDDLGSALGSLNAVAAKFAVESSDIVTAIKKTGGAFAAAGGDLNDLIALFTSVRATTRETAETISTGFRTIFTRIQRTRTIDFFEKLGIQLRELRDDGTRAFVGPYEAIRRLSEALNKIPTGDVRLSQIYEELGGFRQIGKVIPLIKQFNVAEQARIVAVREADSLDKDAEKSQAALGLRIQKVKEEFQALIRTISGNDFFQSFINGGLRLSTVLLQLASTLEKVLPLFLSAGVGKAIGFLPRFGSTFLPGLGVGKLTQRAPEIGGVASVILPTILQPLLGFGKETDKATKHLQSLGLVTASVNFALRTLQESLVNPRNARENLEPIKLNLERGNRRGIKAESRAGRDLNLQRVINTDIEKDYNSLKSKIIANSVALRYGNLSPTAAKSASAQLDVDTIRLKEVNRHKRAGELEESRLAKELGIIGQNNNARIKELKIVNKNIAALQKQEVALGGLNFALAFAVGNLVTWGQALEQSAEAELKLGNARASGKFAVGRGTTAAGNAAGVGAGAGGIVGGLAGSVFPGIGTFAGFFGGSAIGAGLGALGGFGFGHTQGKKEAQNILETGRFDRKFDELKRSLDNVQKGLSTPSSQIGGFRTGLDLLKNRLITTSAENKETAEGKISEAIVGIEHFVNEVIKTVHSFDELDAVLGAGVLEKFALFSKLPFDKLKENIEKQIKSQEAIIKSNKIITDAQENQLKRIQLFNNLTGALQDAIDSINSFSDVLDNTNIKDLSEIFTRVESITNSNLLRTATRQVSGTFGGPGNKIADEFLHTSQVLSHLPDVIIEATSKRFDQSKEFIDEFEDVLKRQFPGISDNLVNALKSNVLKFRGAESKDEKIFAAIQENPTNFIKEAVGGIIEAETKFFQENSKLLTQQLNDLAALYEKRRAVEAKLIENLNSTVNIREQKAAFSFESRGETLPFGFAKGFEKERLNTSLNGRPFTNVEDLGIGALSSQKNIVKLNQILQRETDGRERVLESLEKEKDTLTDLIRGLEFFADVTARNVGAQKELERVQKNNQAKFDFAKNFTFSDLTGRRNLASGALGAGLLARTNDVQRVPGNLRGESLSFLERFNDVPLDFLNGKRGKDVIKDTVEQFLLSSGFDKEDAAKLATKAATSQEQELINAINSNFDNAAKAQESLRKLIEDRQYNVLKDIAANTSGLSALLEKNLLSTSKGEAQRELTSLSGERKGGEVQAKSFDEIIRITGANEKTFSNFRSAIPQLESLQKQSSAFSKNISLLTKANEAARVKETISSGGDPSAQILENVSKIEAEFNSFNKLFPRFNLSSSSALNKKVTETDLDTLQSQFAEKFGPDLRSKVFDLDFIKNIQLGKTSFGDVRNVVEDKLSELFKGAGEERIKLNVSLRDLGDQLGHTITPKILENAGRLKTLFENIPQDANWQSLIDLQKRAGELDDQIEVLTGHIKNLNDRINSLGGGVKPVERARGGFIPGYGGGDIVPAMLEPGEFIINKRAANKLGYNYLNNMNNAHKFGVGGSVFSKYALNALSKKKKSENLYSLSDESPKLDLGEMAPAQTGERIAVPGYANGGYVAARKARRAAYLKNRVSYKDRHKSVSARQRQVNRFGEDVVKAKEDNAREAFFRRTVFVNTQRTAPSRENVEKIKQASINKEIAKNALSGLGGNKLNPLISGASHFAAERDRVMASAKDSAKYFTSERERVAESAKKSAEHFASERARVMGKAATKNVPAKPLEVTLPLDTKFSSKEDEELPIELPISKPIVKLPNESKSPIKISPFEVNEPTAGKEAILDLLKTRKNKRLFDVSQAHLDALDIPYSPGSLADLSKEKYNNILEKAATKFRAPPKQVGFEIDKEQMLENMKTYPKERQVKQNIISNNDNKEKKPSLLDRILTKAVEAEQQVNIGIDKGIRNTGSVIESILLPNIHKEKTGRKKLPILGDVFGFAERLAVGVERGSQTPLEFNRGGSVPGIGNKDSVPAMLTPGEYVLDKKKAKHYANGGFVSKNTSIDNGGSGGHYGPPPEMKVSPQVIEIMRNFGENTNRLSQSLDTFPRIIEMSVRHTIEVIHNGAEVFQSLNKDFSALVEATVSRELNKMLKTKFPDAGTY